MSNFLHGLGGGIGRGIGRFIAILIIAFLIYLVVNLLDLDIKNDILNRVLMLNVSAKQQSSTSFNIYTPYNGDCTGGQAGYCATQTNGTSYKRSKNTTYNGVLGMISFDVSYVMNNAFQYTLNIYAMSTDFRNNNLTILACGYNTNYNSCTDLNISYSMVSKNQISINFPIQSYQNYTIKIMGDPLTGVSTYGIKKLELVWDDGSQDYSGIIDNQTQNTTDIINNNNSNTQDLISQVQDLITNNEELNQKLIDAQSCPIGPLAIVREDWTYISNKYLNSSGEQITQNGYSISPYVDIKPNTEYEIRLSGQFNTPSLCFYDQKSTSSNSLISCVQYSRRTNFIVTSPSNAEYMLLSFMTTGGVTLKGPVCNDWQKEAQDKLNQLQNDTNDLIKDDSIDQGQANLFFNDFDDDDHGLASIVTLPLTTIQSLTSEQCVVLQLPVPFTNEHFTLPCMSQIYQDKVPALYNLWQIVCYGLIGYWIATDIFKLVKEFKDPEQDKVEVMDL